MGQRKPNPDDVRRNGRAAKGAVQGSQRRGQHRRHSGRDCRCEDYAGADDDPPQLQGYGGDADEEEASEAKREIGGRIVGKYIWSYAKSFNWRDVLNWYSARRKCVHIFW